MKLFSKPKNGWVNINIGNHTIDASYITDVPMDFLNALISHYKYGTPFSVYVDEEGQEDVICLCGELIIISILNGMEVIDHKTIRVDNVAFINDIIYGIEEYFDSWVDWFLDDDEEIMEKRALELREKLTEAKELAKEYIKRSDELEDKNFNKYLSKDNKIAIKLTKGYEQNDVGEYDFYASLDNKFFIGLFVYNTNEYGELTDEQIISNQVAILSETRNMTAVSDNSIQELYDKRINTVEYLSSKSDSSDTIISLSTIRFRDIPNYIVLAIQSASKDEYYSYKAIMKGNLANIQFNNEE